MLYNILTAPDDDEEDEDAKKNVATRTKTTREVHPGGGTRASFPLLENMYTSTTPKTEPTPSQSSSVIISSVGSGVDHFTSKVERDLPEKEVILKKKIAILSFYLHNYLFFPFRFRHCKTTHCPTTPTAWRSSKRWRPSSPSHPLEASMWWVSWTTLRTPSTSRSFRYKIWLTSPSALRASRRWVAPTSLSSSRKLFRRYSSSVRRTSSTLRRTPSSCGW